MTLKWSRLLAILASAVTLAACAGIAYGQISFRAAATAGAIAPIAFRASASAGAGSGVLTLTINKPAGTVLNDVMIASIGVRPNTAAVTPPGGWTLVRRIDSTAGTSNSLLVYSKAAGASEPASYSWGFSSSTGSVGGIVAFSGVDAANPIDVENGQPTPSALTHATPSVTTTLPNTMLVTSHTFSSAATWTPPAGMTERVDVQGGLQSIEINHVTQAAAGVTGTKTATASADADGGNAHILALRPQTGLTINLPAGTIQDDVMIASVAVRPPAPTPAPAILFVNAGAPAVNEAGCPRSITPAIPAGNVDDLLIAQVVVREDSATVTASAGWTQLYAATYSPAGQELRAFLYYRVATGSDALTVTASGTCNTMGGQISRFRNVDPGQPFLNVPIPGANVVMQSSDNIDTGTETTVDATAMLLVASFVNDDLGIAQGAGWNVAYESAGNLNRDAAINLHYQLQTTAGAKSVSNWSMGATAANIGVIFSLRPLPPTQSSVTLTAPSGWTLVSRTDNTNTNANSLAVYIKVAGASEPASYTWGVSANTGVTGGIQSFAGVDISNPIDVQNGQTTAAGLAHAAPSVTTTVADAMLVTSHAFSSAATWTSPTGMTQGFTVSSIATPNAAGISIQCNYVLQTTAGATGTKTATAANDADVGNGHIVALRPAIVTPPTPGGFNAFETSTGAGQITGVIRTRVAGVAISIDIVALDAARTAVLTTFTGAVRVDILDSSNNGGALDPTTGCRATWASIATLSPDPTFVAGDNGRRTISFTIPNVYREARVRVRYPAASPTVTGCSTDNFAVRPSAFSLAVTDSTWDTAGTTRPLANTGAAGGNVHKAGRNFTLTVTPAPGTATNYNGDPTVSALACALPATCANGTLTPGAFAGAGSRASTTATYSEAGAFNLTMIDQTFASVDSADGTPTDCTATGRYICQSPAPLAVGRFVPDRFTITSVTAPQFRTFDALNAACSGPRSFTYIGQPFGYVTAPSGTVTAQNAAGGTTTNYRGALWKLTAAGASQSFANTPAKAIDSSLVGAPTLAEIANSGTGTLTANAADKIWFVRDNATPSGPFNADLRLSWTVSDASENVANQGIIGTPTPLDFTSIAFDAGNQFRYGRLRLVNANGSQLSPLPVVMEAQYAAFTNPPTNTVLGFVTNTADNCTAIANNNVAMAFSGNLAACETAVSGAGTLSAGRRTLLLPAPGNGNDGAALLTANLGAGASGTTCTVVGGGTVPASGANRTYLQGNWTAAVYDDNPTARATFGTFKGAGEVIFIRENF